ncbi:MAG TPA: flippase activity-associated protein Agl23, partial [Dehalococcoidia bacterium]|nr:flippase activity-associated protein Agl23 [Dehalococcoidia bacterium]
MQGVQGPPTPGATPETRIRLWRRLFVGWSTWELVFWALLVAAAALTRFWDLGTRALHHDESLHAYFSWLLAEGRGYRHDPLMHGPFQFHATTFIFRLLGDSDASARYLPAFGGTAAVAVMALFRPYLGRVGALTGGLFMAISPTMLYFGRFVRNDIYMVVWGLLWAYGLWRYRDTGQVRFLTLGTVALALSFATKETAYITFALFMAFLAVANGPELA